MELFIFVVVSQIALIYWIVLLVKRGLVPEGEMQMTPAILLFAVIIIPVIEELLFRGIPLLLSDELFSLPFIAAHVLFAWIHNENYAFGFGYMIPNLIAFAALCSLVAFVWGIEWSIMFHVGNNFCVCLYSLVRQKYFTYT